MNNQNSNIDNFIEQLSDIKNVLKPRIIGKEKKKVVPASFAKSFVTIVGIKKTTSRFLPVSHEGYSTETFIDKIDLLGLPRAEFIARKLKGMERRAHMTMFRELLKKEDGKKQWDEIFKNKFDVACYIPDLICVTCWNCSLFGGLNNKEKHPKKGFGTFSRIRYFDTYSIESAEQCVAMEGTEEGMGIGNVVYEDLSKERGSESYHQYEYVKAGTHFPFITIIENATLLDVAGYIKTVKIADQHGYGKYSANHGKFDTNFFSISTGFPKFSILDMLEWKIDDFAKNIKDAGFETNVGESLSLYGSEILEIKNKLNDEFKKYWKSLNN